jgi:hypothetical protein
VNSIEISVTNLWRNRIVGDAQSRSAASTKTNIKPPNPDARLIPSGLIGAPRWLIFNASQ